MRDNPELQAQIAALRIQNSFRSKLMHRLEQQWRDRLKDSAAAAADRESALKVSGTRHFHPCGFSGCICARSGRVVVVKPRIHRLLEPLV